MIKKFILLIIVCLSLGAFGQFNCIKINEKAKNEIQIAIQNVEKYIQVNSEFPKNIDNYFEENGIKTNIKMWLLSSKITVFKHEGNYRIEYYEKPFGPFSGYDFGINEWYYTE